MNLTIAATPGIASTFSQGNAASTYCVNQIGMDERRKLSRSWRVTRPYERVDHPIKAIEQTIRDIENRLAAIDESSKPGDRRRR